MWMDKCYSSGIPDGEEVPDQLVNSNRVPTYKRIALAILRNDHNLKSLGFESSNWNQCMVDQIEAMHYNKNQLNLF